MAFDSLVVGSRVDSDDVYSRGLRALRDPYHRSSQLLSYQRLQEFRYVSSIVCILFTYRNLYDT